MTSLKSSINMVEDKLSHHQDNDKAVELNELNIELNTTKKACCFKLSPTKSTAFVHVSLNDVVSMCTVLTIISITQLPINMNDATTGHTLQSISEDKLIVVSWFFIPNRIYVVLSRVHTLKDFYHY